MNEVFPEASAATLVAGAVAVPGRHTVTLDPNLKARLDEIDMEKSRKEKLRAQIVRERRVLFPMLAVALFLFPNFGRATVVGKSMEPALHTGDSLILLKSYRLFSPLKVGDVIVIQKKEGKLQGEDLVKRIAFIQNETGDAPWPKTIMTSRGNLITKHYFPREVLGFSSVPKNQILVIGDNTPVSVDSRDPDVGPIDESEILGKVLFQ